MRVLMAVVTTLAISSGALSDESTVPIDPDRLRLELIGDDWQLRSGSTTLKNFGRAYADAQEALRIVRTLRANTYGRLGPPGTFEYWLVDGHAPPPFPTRGRARTFDPSKVELKEYQGIWYLGDIRGVLFNFGPSRNDAVAALAVLRRFEFNAFVTIGSPQPRMTVMFRDPQPGLAELATAKPTNPLMRHAELTEQLLILPEIGCVGRKIPIEARKLEVRRTNGQWRLFHDADELAAFGASQLDAMQAERSLRDGRVTELCPLASSSEAGPIWLPLSWGRLRTGVPLGINETSIQPDRLQLHRNDAGWFLVEPRQEVRPAIGPIPDEAQAKALLAVIRHLGTDRLARIGPESGGLRFLAKSR